MNIFFWLLSFILITMMIGCYNDDIRFSEYVGKYAAHIVIAYNKEIQLSQKENK